MKYEEVTEVEVLLFLFISKTMRENDLIVVADSLLKDLKWIL